MIGEVRADSLRVVDAKGRCLDCRLQVKTIPLLASILWEPLLVVIEAVLFWVTWFVKREAHLAALW